MENVRSDITDILGYYQEKYEWPINGLKDFNQIAYFMEREGFSDDATTLLAIGKNLEKRIEEEFNVTTT
jgi:hypothetical protein